MGDNDGNQGNDRHLTNVKENDAILQALVSRVVNETVFPNKQFIVLERELDAKGKLAEKCLSALRMDDGQWDNIKDLIRKQLTQKRNNAQSCVRRSLMRKCNVSLRFVFRHLIGFKLLLYRLFGTKWGQFDPIETSTNDEKGQGSISLVFG